MTAELLSVIVLLEPGTLPPDLEEVLLCLAVQEHKPLQTVIVCDEGQIEAVQTAGDKTPWCAEMRFDIFARSSRDLSNNAQRLNSALAACKGRFVSVLRTNDIAYGFAFKKLIDTLNTVAEPIAIGGTRSVQQRPDGYILSKTNIARTGKATFDIWFDENCARHFVIDRSRITGNLATEASLDYSETYFLLLALSLNNEFSFANAAESLFERRFRPELANNSDEKQKLVLRAQSKIIEWKTSQLTSFKSHSKT